MTTRRILPVLVCLAATAVSAAPLEPVNENASPEARALLQVLVSISGTRTLSGQHNFPNTRSRNSEFVKLHLGETPAVYSQDWGFAAAGDKDAYLARPDIVEEAKAQHARGAIVTLCWHAVPPTADEPVTFQPAGPQAAGGPLASVQGRLSEDEWRELLRPGSALHERWLRQVDTVAGFLAQLRDARVPVLWRPYHEMNGDWFWWGGRGADTAALYRQIFDRFVKHHRLDNLVWVWSVDRPGEHATSFESVYPGDAYADVLALDVYGADFAQSYYDGLLALAKGRPIVLGEVGNPPTPEILARQPRWALYVVWAGMHRSTPRRQQRALAEEPRVLHLEDEAYWEAVAPLRRLAGRPAGYAENVRLDREGRRIDFSGVWRIDEEESLFGSDGPGPWPATLEVRQGRDALFVRRTVLSEYERDEVSEETTPLDGSEARSEFRGAPRVTKALWSEDGATLRVESRVAFDSGGAPFEATSVEEWTLSDAGRTLSIRLSAGAPWGSRAATLRYRRP